MSKKKATNNATLQNTISAIQEKANSFNKEALNATEELVEGSVDTVKKWQDLMAKVLNSGTELLERQQNFSIDVLENVVNQTKTGGNRTKELVNFDFNFKSIWEKNKEKLSVKNLVTNFKKNADEMADDIVKKGKKAATKAKKSTKKVVKRGRKAATTAKKKANVMAEEVATKSKKTVATASKAVEEKVAQ